MATLVENRVSAVPIKVPVSDAIQGHAPATQSDEYGGFPPRIMGPAIKRFKKIVT